MKGISYRMMVLAVVWLLGFGVACAGDNGVSQQSVGVSIGESGARVTYIHDGANYGLAFGKELGRSDRWNTAAWLVFQPEDNKQIATGLSIGYDIHIPSLDKVTVTPLCGVLTDVTAGYDGHDTRLFWGVSVNVAF